MSEPKFTKGPWVIDSATRPAEVCTIHGLSESETDGQGFAYVRGALGYWEAEEEENMANARLIAAAPELAEHAAGLIGSVMERYGLSSPAELTCPHMRGLAAALDKSRGEP